MRKKSAYSFTALQKSLSVFFAVASKYNTYLISTLNNISGMTSHKYCLLARQLASTLDVVFRQISTFLEDSVFMGFRGL